MDIQDAQMEFADATAPFLESGSIRPPSYSSSAVDAGRNVQPRFAANLNPTPPPRYDDAVAPSFPAPSFPAPTQPRGPGQERRRTNSITSTASVIGLV